jgi:PAS fold
MTAILGRRLGEVFPSPTAERLRATLDEVLRTGAGRNSIEIMELAGEPPRAFEIRMAGDRAGIVVHESI